MIRYSIHGELVEPHFTDWLKEVSKIIPGFTVVKVDGYWQGRPETAFQLQVLVAEAPPPIQTQNALLKLAEDYRIAAGQAEVWITFEQNIQLHIVKSQIVKPQIALN